LTQSLFIQALFWGEGPLSSISRVGMEGIVASFAITMCCLSYVYLNQNFDLGTLLIGVILPFTAGSLILVVLRQRILLFAFIAYFWSLVDDAPVHFDSVLTWPEVTRYQPFIPYFVDFVLLAVVFASLYLAVRECTKGKILSKERKVQLAFLILVIFGLSYLQDIEIWPIHPIVADYFYELDLVEHLLSATVLGFTLKLALGSSSRQKV